MTENEIIMKVASNVVSDLAERKLIVGSESVSMFICNALYGAHFDSAQFDRIHEAVTAWDATRRLVDGVTN